MESLWTDWRKTALGAVAFAVLAMLFTHEGGVADTAVSGAEDLAVRKQDQIRAGAEDHKAWFAADESTYEVQAAPPPPRAAAPVAALANPQVVHNAEPVGPDFPVGLKPPA